MKPKRLSAVYNIVYTFDSIVWMSLGISLISIAYALKLIYHNNDKVTEVIIQ